MVRDALFPSAAVLLAYGVGSLLDTVSPIFTGVATSVVAALIVAHVLAAVRMFNWKTKTEERVGSLEKAFQEQRLVLERLDGKLDLLPVMNERMDRAEADIASMHKHGSERDTSRSSFEADMLTAIRALEQQFKRRRH